MSLEAKTTELETARENIASSTVYKVLTQLFDEGAFTEIDAFAKSTSDYAEVVAGRGNVEGVGVFAFAQNSERSGGAMSKAQAAKIKKVYELALKTGSPVIAIYDSIGGRIDEGSDLLSAYGDVLKYSSNLSGVVPQISVVLGKCYGTQALIAVNTDIVILSENAKMTLNTDGSEADTKTNAEHGIAHITAKDTAEAIEKARRLISILPSNNLEYAGTSEFDEPSEQSEALEAIADGNSIIELQPEYGKSMKTVLATIEGTTVGMVKSEAPVIDSKGASKAARFVRFCDAFGVPIITLVDSERFSCIKSAAKLSSAYSEATSPKIAIVTGNAYGAVYIALAGTGAAADITYAWVDASVSALTPETAAVIELGDDFGGKLKGAADPKAERAKLTAQYKDENLTAMKAAEDGYIDEIILPEETRAKLTSAIDMLSDKRVSTLPKKHNNLYI